MRFSNIISALVGATALLASSSAAAASESLITHELTGKVGPYPIGMQLQLRDNTVLTAAHYFYVKHLVDIPLTGRLSGQTMTLEGADGGVFKLHFISTRSADGRPLSFSDSGGLSGVWTKGGASLPVTVGFNWEIHGELGRLYDSVTDLSDAEYETKVRKFVQGAINGDREAVASFVSYPLWVNGPGTRRRAIRNRAALVAQWNSIFTPALLKVLKAATPHEMFTRSGQACLGLCEVWFDDKGAIAINLP
jgi:hypothetical protein